MIYYNLKWRCLSAVRILNYRIEIEGVFAKSVGTDSLYEQKVSVGH